MRTRLCLGTLLLAACTAAAAFVAVDAEGTRHGPFELRNGAEMALGGETYAVEGLPETPIQVEIECLFVAVPKATVEQAMRSGRVYSEVILQSVRDGEAKLVAAPRLITKDRVEGTVKSVVEHVYPTEFVVNRGSTNANAMASNGAVEPREFETREVGAILQVVPAVMPGSQIIDLTLAPQIVQHPRWKDYALPEAAEGRPSAPPRTAPIEVPFFPVDSIATSIQVRSGRTVVAGGGGPSPDGQSLYYLLVTATVVDTEGVDVPVPQDVNARAPDANPKP